MSLTQGLTSPRTPLRRFLDRELSAGVRRLRGTYWAQLPTRPLILPEPGVGFEAGTVGTAIDQRLRLAMTQAVAIDAATTLGVRLLRDTAKILGRHRAWDVIEAVGEQLLERLRTTVAGGRLRAGTEPAGCLSGPTFDGSAYVSADADLIADGLLLDFKSTRRTHNFPLPMVFQLLGYTLMDFTDYRIDRVGIYLTRAGALISWPIEDYLALLGARRRDLSELRIAFQELLAYPGCRADDDPLPDQLSSLDQLLADLAPVIAPGCCRVCAQPLPDDWPGSARVRLYCSPFCRVRAPSLRYHG